MSQKLARYTSLGLAGWVMVPSLALAQSPMDGDRYGWGPGMMGWSGMMIGPFIIVLWLAVAVAVVLLLIRWLGGHGSPFELHSPIGTRNRHLDILKERFARGEIDKSDYEERKRTLEQ